MLIKDGIRTLIDIVIVDPTWVNLLPQFCDTQRFATSNAVQVKERSYCDQHLVDQFLLLAVEVFGYLHKQVDVFLHNYVNAI